MPSLTALKASNQGTRMLNPLPIPLLPPSVLLPAREEICVKERLLILLIGRVPAILLLLESSCLERRMTSTMNVSCLAACTGAISKISCAMRRCRGRGDISNRTKSHNSFERRTPKLDGSGALPSRNFCHKSPVSKIQK